MKALDAAAIVLKDANGPLHYREITERMLARKLWIYGGKDALGHGKSSQLADGYQTSCGSASRFVRAGPGMLALSTSAAAGRSSVTDAAESEQEHDRRRLGEDAESLSFTDAAEWVSEPAPRTSSRCTTSEITKRARECVA